MCSLIFLLCLAGNLVTCESTSPPHNERLTLGYLTGSIWSTDDHFYNKPGQVISGAITLAVQEVNDDPDILPDHTLDFVVAETYGKELESIKQTVQLLGKNVSVFLGPQETCVTEAKIAAAFNLPMISYYCTDPAVSDKDKFPTFARTKPHDSQISAALVLVLLRYNWQNVVLVYNNNHAYIASTIQKTMMSHGITVLDVKAYVGPFLEGFVDSNPTLNKIIKDTHKKTNVYVLLGDLYDEYREFLIELQKEGHGNHVVVGVDTRRYDNDDPQKYIEGYFFQGTSAPDIEAFRRFLLVAPSAPVDPGYKNFSRLVNHYLESPPFNFVNPFSASGILKIIRPEACYLYDAVWLYARAADQAIKRGYDVKDGRRIIQMIRGTAYTSAMGFRVHIDQNGDAQGNFTLLSLQQGQGNQGYGMYPTAMLSEDLNSGKGLMQYLDGQRISWATSIDTW